MKAVVDRGPFSVAIEELADPTIERPSDATIRLTATNIGGSDLHRSEGRTSVEVGKVLGHETMGIVEAVGAAVDRIGESRPAATVSVTASQLSRQPQHAEGRDLRRKPSTLFRVAIDAGPVLPR